MPTVQDRVKQIREEVQSRLDLDDEQFKALASNAAMKISHPTGEWQAGQHVPSRDKEDWIIVGAFDHSPYEPGEQGDEWTYGEVRAYVLCPADVFGQMRDFVVAPGADMICMMYRLMASGALIAKPKTEDAFTDALCDEFEALAEMAGIGGEGGGDEWRCPCGKLNPDELETEDEDAESQKTSFCGGCGSARVEVVQ